MEKYDERIGAYYGGDNDYYILENGNILEVRADDLDWDEFKSWDDFRGIADDFEDLRMQLSSEVYWGITDRAIDHYIKENEGKFVVENAGIPGAGNVWNLYDKETGDCLFGDDVYTNEQDAYRDVVAAYFAQDVAQTALSREVWGYVRDYDDLKGLLKYCEDKNIDISDLLEYQEVSSRVNRYSDAIAFVTKEMADSAGNTPANMIDGIASELQSYLDNDVFYVTEYDKKGNEIDSCGGFIGDNIKDNGIEDNFGIVVERLGEFENIDKALSSKMMAMIEEFAAENDLDVSLTCDDLYIELTFESDNGVDVTIGVDLREVGSMSALKDLLHETAEEYDEHEHLDIKQALNELADKADEKAKIEQAKDKEEEKREEELRKEEEQKKKKKGPLGIER